MTAFKFSFPLVLNKDGWTRERLKRKHEVGKDTDSPSTRLRNVRLRCADDVSHFVVVVVVIITKKKANCLREGQAHRLYWRSNDCSVVLHDVIALFFLFS